MEFFFLGLGFFVAKVLVRWGGGGGGWWVQISTLKLQHFLSVRVSQKVYEGAWEAENLDQLAKRIILKAKELNQSVVTRMIFDIRRKLLKMYRQGVQSVC